MKLSSLRVDKSLGKEAAQFFINKKSCILANDKITYLTSMLKWCVFGKNASKMLLAT